jgi:hypothetical protein
MYGRQKRYMQSFGGETLGERETLEDLGVDRRVILKIDLRIGMRRHGLD